MLSEWSLHQEQSADIESEPRIHRRGGTEARCNKSDYTYRAVIYPTLAVCFLLVGISEVKISGIGNVPDSSRI